MECLSKTRHQGIGSPATKLVMALCCESYQERLRILDFLRRSWENYEGILKRTVLSMIQMSYQEHLQSMLLTTQGNLLKAADHRSNMRKYWFCFRITNVWNSLPFSVTTAPLVNSVHHNSEELNVIGEQKYQVPGVEAELNFEFFWVLPWHLLKTIWA